MVLTVSKRDDGPSGPQDSRLGYDAAPDDGARVYHEPVLLSEAARHLVARVDGVYVDATLGEGGHSAAILEAAAPDGRVLGLDRDPRSLAVAQRRLRGYGPRFTALQASFARLSEAARSRGVAAADGVLMDLGISSRQLQAPGYGLSFQSDEPLDMRLDPAAPLTAREIVNDYPEERLAALLREYGEEPRAGRIARAIVRARPVETTAQLAGLIAALGPGRMRRLHPATRAFQALRIAVNDELGALREGLAAAVGLLSPGGRLVVISYHSLEDRIVKNFLAREAADCLCPPGLPVCVCGHQPTMRAISRRVIKPSPREVDSNPRSRSARMRVSERRRRVSIEPNSV